MKSTFLMVFAMLITTNVSAELTADELFDKGLELIKEKQSRAFKKRDDNPVPGGLIKRHPLLNHARRLFKNGAKNPNATQARQGDLWTCLKFSGLDFDSELMPSTLTRGLSFNSFGSGILEEVSYGSNIIKMYALDNTDLAGINESGDLYEAIRLTENGDLILESSVQGISWYQRFFTSLISGGKDITKLLKIVQKAMVISIAQGDNNGLVYDYTVCPGSRVVERK